MNALANALNARVNDELANGTMNDNKRQTLAKMMKSASDVIAQAFVDCNVDLSFMSARSRQTAQRNVYMLERAIDLASFIAGNVTLNHFTMHIAASLATLRSAGVECLSHDAARLCCTSLRDEEKKTPKDIIAKLSRVSKAIALSTVNTQVTLSLQSLLVFQVIEESSSPSGDVTYRLTMNDNCKRFYERLLATNKISAFDFGDEVENDAGDDKQD